jgi:hypothetical protein
VYSQKNSYIYIIRTLKRSKVNQILIQKHSYSGSVLYKIPSKFVKGLESWYVQATPTLSKSAVKMSEANLNPYNYSKYNVDLPN